MSIDKESISKRLNGLMKLALTKKPACIEEAASSTIHILEMFYGNDSEKLKGYLKHYTNFLNNLQRTTQIAAEGKRTKIRNATYGTLKSIKSEVEAGLVGNIELQAQGGIFGDFINLAKESLDENKDVAAVLVCAALEDALKKFALQNDLNVDDANMEQVINALKGKGLIKGTQASLAKGHKQLRKNAFHAKWDKIDKVSVNSAIGFTESFILEHFS